MKRSDRSLKHLTVTGIAVLFCTLGLALARPAHAQYTVESQSSFARGNLWIGEGIAAVESANSSVGHRFRLGGELHLAEDYRFILGLVFLDRIWSGESSGSAGEIARGSFDFELGYFVLPDKLWLMYSLAIQELTGSAVIGTVSPLGHQFSVGYRFFSNRYFNLSLEGAYLFSPTYVATTFNYSTNAGGTAVFPVANIWSLNLRIGFDIGAP
jgi:hypothetical protein